MAMPSATQGSTADEQQYRFPPFPAPPAGISVLPFSAFVPQGYRHITGPSGDPIEVDGWVGIQTLKVLNEKEVKEKNKSKKKQRNAGKAVDSEGRLIPWWEEWEKGEALRAMSETSFASMSFEDRVHLAADDFRVGRPWPEIALGVRLMWDQFRVYIGLLSSIPVYKKIKNRQTGQVDAPSNGGEASEEEGDAPKVNHTKTDIVQDYFEQTALPGKQLEPRPDDSTAEAQRLRAFVGDIEKTIEVFLSSYMCDTGLIWSERNLFVTPTILHFFLRFVLRNNVFADSEEHLDNLKRAIAVAALAQKELPITARLGQRLPGPFDLACRECWGTQGSLITRISATLSPTNVDDTATNDTPPADTHSVFEAVLEENDVEVVPSNVVLDSVTARQVMENKLDTDHQVPITTIPAEGNPWTATTRAEECTTASWTDVSVPWLMQLLGPSVFPLTMTTGIIEFSTRRIRDVIATGVNVGRIGGVSAVEEVLGEKFFRVVLSPWVGSMSEETADFPGPAIVPGSRGAVVAREMVDADVDANAWNPYRDDVTILVSEEMAGQMGAGMGLCGTWVQMVAEGYERHARECYWYIESLIATFPSYYTEGDTIGQVLAEVLEDEDL